MMTQKTSKQTNAADKSVLVESPQSDIAVRPKHKPCNSSRKRKIFPEDSTTGTVLRLKKKLSPDLQLSGKASLEIGDFIKDQVKNFESSLWNLRRYNRPKTLTVRELECATRLLLPPELATKAAIAGERAALKVKSSSPGEIPRPSSDVSMETAEVPPASPTASGKQMNSDPDLDVNFGSYILRLKKLLHPDLQLSKQSVGIVNSFLVDVMAQFHPCLRSLPRISKRKTLSVRDQECATRLCLPPILGECAKAYGNEALKRARQP